MQVDVVNSVDMRCVYQSQQQLTSRHTPRCGRWVYRCVIKLVNIRIPNWKREKKPSTSSRCVSDASKSVRKGLLSLTLKKWRMNKFVAGNFFNTLINSKFIPNLPIIVAWNVNETSVGLLKTYFYLQKFKTLR